MFRIIWEFAQSQDCVAHSRNPEIVQEISRLRKPCVRAISRSLAPVRPTASDLCVARRIEDILDRQRLAPYYDLSLPVDCSWPQSVYATCTSPIECILS